MRVLGLMSGTSADGVDAAVADLRPTGRDLHLHRVGEVTYPWPDRLRDRILAAGAATTEEVCRLHHDLGSALGEMAAAAAQRWGPVDLVASHGQTVHHDVDTAGRVRGTLQLGQPAQVAERTGLPVVADFRVRDVAAGGQGAPLVSRFDELLLAGAGPASAGEPGAGAAPVAALNIGGIANLTVVAPDRPTVAFDCGPGNALLDAAVSLATGQRYDPDGATTARGTVDPDLLAVLATDPYPAAPPPKSTGKERYHAGYLAAALAQAPVAALADQLATLAAFTATTVAGACARYGVRRVWAAGGGVRNTGLLAALRHRLTETGAALATTDQLGVPADAKEAYAFAVLGWLTWHGLPGNVPAGTGAAGPRLLGTITPGAVPPRLPPPAAAAPHRMLVHGTT